MTSAALTVDISKYSSESSTLWFFSHCFWTCDPTAYLTQIWNLLDSSMRIKIKRIAISIWNSSNLPSSFLYLFLLSLLPFFFFFGPSDTHVLIRYFAIIFFYLTKQINLLKCFKSQSGFLDSNDSQMLCGTLPPGRFRHSHIAFSFVSPGFFFPLTFRIQFILIVFLIASMFCCCCWFKIYNNCFPLKYEEQQRHSANCH